MPHEFTFGSQADVASYKQLGNGVSVGAVYQVVRAAVERDHLILKETNPGLAKSVIKSEIYPKFMNRATESKDRKIS
jgi:DNA (cytosine-5)-methyltransferase 1